MSPLRDEGILILGSGNLVHNLHAYSWGRQETAALDWALEFETEAKRLLSEHNHEPLIAYESMGPAAMLSAPTPDHYLPFLYADSALPRRREPQLSGRRLRRRLNLDAVRPHRLEPSLRGRKKTTMSTPEELMELMQTLDDAWNAQDLDTFASRHKTDTVVRWPGQGDTHGVGAHKARRWHSSRPSRTSTWTTGLTRCSCRTANGPAPSPASAAP